MTTDTSSAICCIANNKYLSGNLSNTFTAICFSPLLEDLPFSFFFFDLQLLSPLKSVRTLLSWEQNIYILLFHDVVSIETIASDDRMTVNLEQLVG